MSKILQITLGILASIGGFFDMGEIVTTAVVGARFGFGLIWVVLLGTVGIIIYAEMSGRIATMSGRPVFDVVRERLGAKVAILNLAGSMMVNILTLVAEVAGIALAFQLLSGVSYYLWVPFAVAIALFIIWKVSFEMMERSLGIIGLTMLVFAVALWRLGPDWSHLIAGIFEPDIPKTETVAGYWYFAVAIFGASMTPYEVFFYSSGAVEEKWDESDLSVNRGTAFIGFVVGGMIAGCAIAVAALVFKPHGIEVDSLSTVALGPAVALGSVGIACFLIGLFASTIGATLEVTLSNGYAISQFFGWPWGKFVKAKDAPIFHLVIIVSLVVAALVVFTSVDPIKITELSVVFSAVALPLTYIPVLIVANDKEYMKEHTNGRVLNVLGSMYLGLIVLASLAAIPLMIWTKMGS